MALKRYDSIISLSCYCYNTKRNYDNLDLLDELVAVVVDGEVDRDLLPVVEIFLGQAGFQQHFTWNKIA